MKNRQNLEQKYGDYVKNVKYATYGFEVIVPCKYNGIRVQLLKRSFSYEGEAELLSKIEYFATELNTNFYYEVV